MSKLLHLKDFNEEKILNLGLTCGIEVHQQLNCGKLFSKAPCKIVPNKSLNKSITRKLRFSLSETGQKDLAAVEEFKKDKFNKYLYNNEIATLVDLDEEPPAPVNRKALNAAIQIGQMFNVTFFNQVIFMRKLIIDGSVVSGFQRTALLGIRGEIKTKASKIHIENINLEEDSARIIENTKTHKTYALDRQGIPLIEITTAPQITNPNQAQEVALHIGTILRSFSQVKRGLGTIRQDINISIKEGKRVEIKGVQNAKLIPQVIKKEMRRQKIIHSICQEVKRRNISKEEIFNSKNIIEVTHIFKNSVFKNSSVFVLILRNFKEILGCEIFENYRFGTEISKRNSLKFPQIKGLIHSDELPNSKISQEKLNNLYKFLNLNSNDSFILIAHKKPQAQESLKYIQKLIYKLTRGVRKEVRQINESRIFTDFLREMSGEHRMYPETDIPKISLSEESLKNLSRSLPELHTKKLNRLEKKWEIESNKIEDLLKLYSEEKLKNLIEISQKNAKYLYNILIEIPKDIKKREKLEGNLHYELLEQLLSLTTQNKITLTTIRDIIISLYRTKFDNASHLKDYLDKRQFIQQNLQPSEIKKEIEKVIKENPKAPFNALMGICMKKLKRNASGKDISNILKKLLQI